MFVLSFWPDPKKYSWQKYTTNESNWKQETVLLKFILIYVHILNIYISWTNREMLQRRCAFLPNKIRFFVYIYLCDTIYGFEPSHDDIYLIKSICFIISIGLSELSTLVFWELISMNELWFGLFIYFTLWKISWIRNRFVYSMNLQLIQNSLFTLFPFEDLC